MNRAAHERHVAAYNAQEEMFAALAREEAQADMLAAEALERQQFAEIEEEDLLHLQAMHEQAMAERSQYELDEAADVAAVAAVQADVAAVAAVTTPQRTEVPMPRAHLLQTIPEAYAHATQQRFHPEHRTHAQRLRDNAEKRAKRDRSLSPLTYIPLLGPADIDLSPFVGRAAGSLVAYAADSIAVEGMPAAYRPPV